MAFERLANLGYLGLVKQVDANTTAIPTDYVEIYDESMQTKGNFVQQKPIYGSKFEVFNVLQGQRSHGGDVTVMAEPNTTARFFDMLLTKGTTTGANPYTHPMTLSNTTQPNFYTVDISTGNVVARFMGVAASNIAALFQDNEMRLKVSLSALGSFQGREIATVATTTLTFKTDYDPAPNKGLVVGDLVRIYKAATGATLDTTIASVNADGITVTLGASAAAFAAGDMIYLRPATPSFNNQATFQWAKTQFCFGATASAALSATQYQLEDSSTWEIAHDFNNDEGELRSGSYDPASLARTTGGAKFKAKKFFDTPEEIRRFNALEKQAVVIRHYAGTTNQYELRVTLNHIKTDGMVKPNLKPGDVEYSDLTYIPQYDSSDGQGMDVKIINSLSSI